MSSISLKRLTSNGIHDIQRQLFRVIFQNRHFFPSRLNLFALKVLIYSVLYDFQNMFILICNIFMYKVQKSLINDGYLDLSNYTGAKSQQIGHQGVKLICTLDTLSIKTILLRWNNISQIGMGAFSSAKWDNLEVLILGDNKIRNIGCKYLSRMLLNNLKQVQLNKNQIEGVGVMHLSKVQWKNIHQIHLSLNPLKIDGTKQITKNDWKDLGYLYMIGCQLIFPDLLHLLMLHTKIRMIDIGDALTEIPQMKVLRELFEKSKPTSQIQL